MIKELRKCLQSRMRQDKEGKMRDVGYVIEMEISNNNSKKTAA